MPLPREGSLSAEVIAAALDTGHALGPAFRRIEEEVDVPVLLDALSLAGTDYARERLCILLAHHGGVAKAVGALPLLRGFLDASDRQLRRSAAYAIGTIAGRAGRARARAADPNLPAVLRERFSVEEDESVRDDLDAALGAFGEPPREPRHDHAERFTHEVRRRLDFLNEEHEFEEPTVEDRWFSTTVTYRNDTTAVVASADWRDSVVEVFLVELRESALPLSLDGTSNSLAPSLLLELTGGAKRAGMLADPRDSVQTRQVLESEAEALMVCDDALRGDFTRFHRAVARLADER